MDQTFSYFVRALRNAEIKVSPAETLDAFEILERIGIHDPFLLKDSLALVLAKTVEEKEKFDQTFDSFFSQFAFASPVKRSMVDSVHQDQIMRPFEGVLPPRLFSAIESAVQGERSLLSHLVQEAAGQVRMEKINSMREKSTYALQIADLLELQKFDNVLESTEVAPFHRYLRHYLRQEIKSYVDNQYKIHVDPTGKKALIQASLKANLSSIPSDYMADVRRVVEKLGERLVKERRRKRSSIHRGVLDLKKTLRKNMAYGGAVFDVRWRQKKKETNTVYVICDVSQSVARVARFLLLLLFELVDVLPNVRAFAFSSALGEVTDVFKKKSSNEAIEDALFTWGKGNTDYGRAWQDFRGLCGSEVDRRSTLVVLGDGRNNFYDPSLDTFREICNRSKSVFWLNPEPRDQWEEGDSEMERFAATCTSVRICNRIEHLERFADELIRVAR